MNGGRDDRRVDGVDLLDLVGAGDDHGAHQRIADQPVALQGGDQPVDDAEHPLPGVVALRLLAQQLVVQRLQLADHRRGQQVDLGREVAVERAERHIGEIGDLAHLDGVVAALAGQRDGRVQDPAPAGALRRRGRPGRREPGLSDRIDGTRPDRATPLGRPAGARC